MFKQKKTQKLSTQGGPHDKEFFRCFKTYLDEAIIQIRGGNQSMCEALAVIDSGNVSDEGSNKSFKA